MFYHLQNPQSEINNLDKIDRNAQTHERFLDILHNLVLHKYDKIPQSVIKHGQQLTRTQKTHTSGL